MKNIKYVYIFVLIIFTSFYLIQCGIKDIFESNDDSKSTQTTKKTNDDKESKNIKTDKPKNKEILDVYDTKKNNKSSDELENSNSSDKVDNNITENKISSLDKNDDLIKPKILSEKLPDPKPESFINNEKKN